MDQIGMTWTTNFGKILLDVETAQWIASNAHTSMLIVIEAMYIIKHYGNFIVRIIA
jgi:hypothetical protein